MFLSAVTKTSNPACSAAVSNPPLASLSDPSHPDGFFHRMILQIAAQRCRNAVIKQDEHRYWTLVQMRESEPQGCGRQIQVPLRFAPA